MMRLRMLLAVLVTVALTPHSAWAHKPSDSYLVLRIADATIEGEWKIALRDLDYAIGLDGDDDGTITWGELRIRHDAIAAYALARLRLAVDAAACTARPIDHLVDRLSDGSYEVLRFVADCPRTSRMISVTYGLFFDLDPLHRGLLRVESAGSTQTTVLSPAQNRWDVDIGAVTAWRQFAAYGHEGIWHIWIGYDHVLFLLSLLLPAVLRRRARDWVAVSRFRDAFTHAAGIVTAFTLAHSITLSLAAFEMIRLPSRLVESAIAASILLAALNNICPLVTRRLWLVAFTFGLAHGFGFASVLADLGLPRGSLLVSLFGFNLGVEFGQLAIVAAFLPLVFGTSRWRYYPRMVLQLGSATIAVVASLWFVQRAFDFAPA